LRDLQNETADALYRLQAGPKRICNAISIRYEAVFVASCNNTACTTKGEKDASASQHFSSPCFNITMLETGLKIMTVSADNSRAWTNRFSKPLI
jgi:hypothetical protein